MENQKLKEFKEKIKNKKVAIIGIGTSNIPAIQYLNQLGANISARDKNCDLFEKHKELGEFSNIEFVLGEHYLDGLEEFDYIIRSPGVQPFLKEIEKAVEKGVILTSEIELLINLAPCKIIGITGSAGKTTTTTLVKELLSSASYHVWLGGNIGIPLFSKLDEIQEKDIMVLELSSFQLMTMKQSPNIALVTNIYEDHLDYHRSKEEYIEAKTNIFSHQKKGDICVLNLDDANTKMFLEQMEKKGIENNKRYFSTQTICKNGVYLKNNSIYINNHGTEEEIVSVSKIHLIGEKNYANICSAICCVSQLVPISCIRKTLKEFRGVEHRLEYVATKNGVKYYNDSISTTPGKAMAAFTSFSQKIILIAGGSDKNLDYTPIGDAIVHCAKEIILLGNTKEKIKHAIVSSFEYSKEKLGIHEVNNMEEAVALSTKLSHPNDIVVMSPASASFDLYANYKERGKHFKNLVNNL